MGKVEQRQGLAVGGKSGEAIAKSILEKFPRRGQDRFDRLEPGECHRGTWRVLQGRHVPQGGDGFRACDLCLRGRLVSGEQDAGGLPYHLILESSNGRDHRGFAARRARGRQHHRALGRGELERARDLRHVRHHLQGASQTGAHPDCPRNGLLPLSQGLRHGRRV